MAVNPVLTFLRLRHLINARRATPSMAVKPGMVMRMVPVNERIVRGARERT